MEQVALFEVLRRHVSMIIAMCIIATIAGYGMCLLMPNRYTAPALVLVRPQHPIKMGTGQDTKEFLDFSMGSASVIETASKTYIQLIKSRELISEVVRQLGLDKEQEAEGGGGRLSKVLPAFMKPAVDSVKQVLKNGLGVLMYGKVLEDDPFDRAASELYSGLELKPQVDTYLFEISYPAKDPQRAADVSNTTAKILIQFVEKLRVSEAQYERDHLKTELELRQQQVNDARERLENYKKAHSVFAYETEYDAKLKVISELEVDLAKANVALVGNQGTLLGASQAAKRARLIRSLGEQQADLAAAPEIEREIKELEEGVKVALTAYEIVDKEFRQADIKLSYDTPEARLVSEAARPRLPSGPARGTIALISLLGGLIAGTGLALFREYRNRGVRGIDDIEDFVGVRVIATIPRVFRRRWRRAGLL